MIMDTDSEQFFDTYEQLPNETGMHFFDAMEAEEQATGITSLEPFAVDELVHHAMTMNCITRSAEAELLRDGQRGLNRPTVLHQGLSSAAFQMLAAG